jgi:hypothetical protein
MVPTEAAGDAELVLAILKALCPNISMDEHVRFVINHMKQVDQTRIEKRENLHIGIVMLTTLVFAMWAYECDPTGYTLSGWIALIAIVTMFIITIAYNVFRVLKLHKSL